jgi:putative ABC transport system permease protein
MYGFKTLHGNSATALNDPFSVVITEEMAIKYFGKTEVIGETVTIQSFSGEKHDFKITAVLKHLNQNSVTHLTTDYPNSFFIPTNTLSYFGRSGIDSWNNMFIASFIKLKERASIDEVQKVVNQLVQKNADPSLQKIITVRPVLLTDYYLQKDKAVVKRMLYALSFVGVFILLMAIVNFISIAISRSSGRMREIGIRKVLGGLRGQLILQFLVESIALVSIATLLALIAYPMIKPVFNQVVGKELPGLSAFPLWFMALPIIIIVLVGLLAGLYPAFVLSAIESVDSLKGKLKTVSGSILLRKSLVGFSI